ncbi:MAG TPA: aldo/keto reductase [Acidisarcina sp.]|nr:aldo/keto reductase [Acidisarcina sp.]
MERREFLKSAAGAALITGLGSSANAFASGGEIPRRVLGRTGVPVSIVGVGGYHIGASSVPEEVGIRIIRTALDSGINFLDNCWDYNGGESERRMGKALRDGYRQKAFLMTKIDGRTAVAAQKQLDESLSRLQTDHIDLIQIHEVIRMEDPERVFAAGGALETLEKARKAGKVRFIGFTGHKSPAMHLHMIDTASQHHYTFDTVQMPVNVMDAQFNSFANQVIPVASKLGMGILGMKGLGGGIFLQSKTVKPVECLHYSISQKVHCQITGCDSMQILNQALDLARNFRPMDEAAMKALRARASSEAVTGELEKYKNTQNFDGTGRNPQWLG